MVTGELNQRTKCTTEPNWKQHLCRDWNRKTEHVSNSNARFSVGINAFKCRNIIHRLVRVNKVHFGLCPGISTLRHGLPLLSDVIFRPKRYDISRGFFSPIIMRKTLFWACKYAFFSFLWTSATVFYYTVKPVDAHFEQGKFTVCTLCKRWIHSLSFVGLHSILVIGIMCIRRKQSSYYWPGKMASLVYSIPNLRGKWASYEIGYFKKPTSNQRAVALGAKINL